jgi:hypothetical protein
MTWTRQKDHVEVVLLDQPVQVDIDEGKAWARAPMAEQAILDVLRTQRFVQEWILQQINHPEAEIVAGSPIDLCFA